jgi:large subunit ribosomal protein L6
MSRIGKAIINIPEGVEINIAEDNIVSVKGKLGERIQKINGDLKISINEGVLSVERPSESKEHKSLHGLS